MTHHRRLSKRLSYVLRHQPDSVGLALDREGWVDVPSLLDALRVDREALEAAVRDDDKQRFELRCDRIRAQQGHSTPVDLGLAPARPPDRLWHGTAEHVLPAVLREGLRPGRRTHVHLSPDPVTARRVGARHGRPVVLVVDAVGAWRAGQVFLLSGNGIWLTDALRPAYLNRQE
ncbi:MAG: RNA 2'-phosphotransferase [Actinomycetota bacterium]|nr:RNA 2'-phosphotransferase [Actinomycetota bacterium]